MLFPETVPARNSLNMSSWCFDSATNRLSSYSSSISQVEDTVGFLLPLKEKIVLVAVVLSEKVEEAFSKGVVFSFPISLFCNAGSPLMRVPCMHLIKSSSGNW